MDEKEQISYIDRAITELVYEKNQLVKAYNYYHGKRDPDQFRHLEENYGLGTATSVEFIPLVRKHIDVLVGEYLSLPVLPKVSCKDKRTLQNIEKEKSYKLNNSAAEMLRNHFKSYLESLEQSNAPTKPLSNGELTDKINAKLQQVDSTFISDYEIASQNIIDWSIQSRNIDFVNKRRILLTDLLVTGTCYYKVEKSESKENVSLRVLNPVHAFVERNSKSNYLKDSPRSVYREYMTKDQILLKYGEELTQDDLDSLESIEDFSMDYATTYIRTTQEQTDGDISGDGILGGFEAVPIYPYERAASYNYRLYPVYEVEWLKTEKEGSGYKVYRYEGIRIGSKIHLVLGKNLEVSRSIDDPKNCSLAMNGLFYADRNGNPFSLILATANLQDKFDMLHFYRDNIISESGTVGDWVDVAFLPKVLGSDLTERLLKWKAYKKQGLALIDSSQEGERLNTIFNGFDDTIKHETIQAIDLAINRVEETCSGITGVFRERLGGVEERDAVTNVKLGVKQSTFITKQHFYAMDLMTREILLDLLNLAKEVYKNGVSGTLILGNRLNKIFTSLPEYYTISDHDIHIADSAEMMREKGVLEQISFEFIKNNSVDADIIVDILTATGLTSMKADLAKALDKKKKENNMLEKMQQQVQQLDSNLQQTSKKASELQKQVEFLNAEKVKLEQEKLAFQKELEWFKAKAQKEFNSSKLELEKKRVDLEALQLIDNNLNNDEIKDK